MRRQHRSAFTLIELLVVLGIIGILVGLTLVVGGSVVAGGKKRQTEETLKNLDNALNAYIAARESGFPGYVEARINNQTLAVPMVDGVADEDQFNGPQQTKARIPTTSWFVYVVSELDKVPAAEQAINVIDAKLKRVGVPNAQGALYEVPGRQIEILDAWGNPIRFVHPKFDGRITSAAPSPGNSGGPLVNTADFLAVSVTWAAPRIRRNALTDDQRQARKDAGEPYMIGDSDGGRCTGDRPYFYSVGPDGDPSTTSDNVYLSPPQFESQ